MSKVLTLQDGKLVLIDNPATDVNECLSGTDFVDTPDTFVIPMNKQSINFTMLTLDGCLDLDGDLWLA